MLQKRCKGVKGDGTPCFAIAQNGRDFCFFHDPRTKEKRREAQRRGGQRGKLDSQEFKDTDSVVRLLSETIQAIKQGKIDSRRANAIGYLSGQIIRALSGVEEIEITEISEITIQGTRIREKMEKLLLEYLGEERLREFYQELNREIRKETFPEKDEISPAFGDDGGH